MVLPRSLCLWPWLVLTLYWSAVVICSYPVSEIPNSSWLVWMTQETEVDVGTSKRLRYAEGVELTEWLGDVTKKWRWKVTEWRHPEGIAWNDFLVQIIQITSRPLVRTSGRVFSEKCWMRAKCLWWNIQRLEVLTGEGSCWSRRDAAETRPSNDQWIQRPMRDSPDSRARMYSKTWLKRKQKPWYRRLRTKWDAKCKEADLTNCFQEERNTRKRRKRKGNEHVQRVTCEYMWYILTSLTILPLKSKGRVCSPVAWASFTVRHCSVSSFAAQLCPGAPCSRRHV